MIATGLVATNIEEVERAVEIGMSIPDYQYAETTLLFNIEDVKRASISRPKSINLDFGDNDVWTIKFDKEILDKLLKKFS